MNNTNVNKLIFNYLLFYFNKYYFNDTLLNFINSKQKNTNIFINYPIFKNKFANNNNNIIENIKINKSIKNVINFVNISNYPFKNYINNFYSYDIFSKSSLILSKAEKMFKKTFTNYI